MSTADLGRFDVEEEEEDEGVEEPPAPLPRIIFFSFSKNFRHFRKKTLLFKIINLKNI
jgi:hypothetical protein